MTKYLSKINIILLAALFLFSGLAFHDANADLNDGLEFKVATWNLLDFGGKCGGYKKRDDPIILDAMSSVISQYDVIFVQEIANIYSNSCNGGSQVDSFNNLCSPDYLGGRGYLCQNTQVISEDNFNCEAYGVIYKSSLNIADIRVEYTGDPEVNPHIPQGSGSSKVIRPPMKATLTTKDNKEIIIYNIHAKYTGGSEDTLTVFDSKVRETADFQSGTRNIIALGDFNADCKPFSGGFASHPTIFPLSTVNGVQSPPDSTNWYDVVPDDATTNFSGTQAVDESTSESCITTTDYIKPGCAYDRIMLNRGMFYTFNPGVDESGASDDDHNIVYRVPDDGSMSANKNFNDVFVTGYSDANTTNRSYTLSDHQLVWAKFRFGGISPTDWLGVPRLGALYNQGEKVYFKGQNFIPGKTYQMYSVSYFPTATAESVNISSENISMGVNVDASGNIANTALPYSDSLVPGAYLIIIDIDGNNEYDKNIDVQETFTVKKTSQKRKRSHTTLTDTVNIDGRVENKVARSVKKGSTAVVFGSGLQENLEAANVVQNAVTGEVVGMLSNVTTDSYGNFTSNITFEKEGIYNLLFHPYEEGPIAYNKEYDTIDYDSQAGFIVTSSDAGYNDLVTISDEGITQEAFDPNVAQNIYLLGKNLPKDENVDIYVVSNKKYNEIFGYTSWEDALTFDAFVRLGDIAVPANSEDYTSGKITIQVQKTSKDGEIFTSVIQDPIFMDRGYVDKWGNIFNVIVDVNRNGIFDNGDKVNTYDVSEIVNCLQSSSCTFPDNATEASVMQYQELLNAKLALNPELVIDGKYGSKTKEASRQYLGSEILTSNMDTLFEKVAEIGFRISCDRQIDGITIGDFTYKCSDLEINNSTFDGYTDINSFKIDLGGNIQSNESFIYADETKIHTNSDLHGLMHFYSSRRKY